MKLMHKMLGEARYRIFDHALQKEKIIFSYIRQTTHSTKATRLMQVYSCLFCKNQFER